MAWEGGKSPEASLHALKALRVLQNCGHCLDPENRNEWIPVPRNQASPFGKEFLLAVCPVNAFQKAWHPGLVLAKHKAAHL